MAGLTLGGGYGPLTPRCGLALDNLLGAEVVLADGRRIMADPLEHPDLFWALRGGGGNFGVVTAMRVRLHSISDVIAGLIVYPWSDAASVLRGYADMAVSFPDELTVLLGVLSGPDGRPVLFLAPTWSGSQSQGELVIAKLEGLGTPLQAHIDVMTCGDAVGRFDAHSVSGRHCALETRWLPALTPHVISALIAAGETITSPYSAIVLQHFRGAPTRIPSGVTAFAMRREHFLLEVVAMWEAGPADDSHRQWVHAVGEAFGRSALPGGYPNLLGPDEHDRIAVAYGSNLIRLRDVKRRFDPDFVFTSAIPLSAGRSRLALRQPSVQPA